MSEYRTLSTGMNRAECSVGRMCSSWVGPHIKELRNGYLGVQATLKGVRLKFKFNFSQNMKR